MKNIYNISKGQFVALWIFSIVIWVGVINESCKWYKEDCFSFGHIQLIHTPIADLASIIIPFLLIFYSIGWRNHRKEIKK